MARRIPKSYRRDPKSYWTEIHTGRSFCTGRSSPVPKPRRSTDHLSRQPQTLLFPASRTPQRTPIFTTRNPSPPDGAPDPIEPLLNLKRAAPLLGISVKTLRDWILYRRIDYVKIGTRVMIRPETIRELVDRNTRRADIA